MTPYYEHAGVTIYHGDCREILPSIDNAEVVITDPPYGETDLKWDRWASGWLSSSIQTRVLWCFGSMRMFLERFGEFNAAGFRFAQDLVWEKHNGSGFHADRFKRVHEHILQFYRGGWADVFKCPVTTLDATARTVRRKQKPPHMHKVGEGTYVSSDGGPRLMRSVIYSRSCHGEAYHPTQKPTGVIVPLLQYSVPPGGLVVDPFGGSGTTAVACKALGIPCTLIEIEERYCELAVSRLAQEVLPLEAAV